MSASAQKDIREIIRKLKKHGVEVAQLPNGHWRTKTTPPVTMSFSPSDTNAARAATRDIRQKLGIDIRLSPAKRKDATNDFAMQRLRERVLKQMERGATIADLARLAVWQSDEKKIGGWANTNAAEVGIQNCLKGGRIVKANHDSLASAVGKLESASGKDFPKHLDQAAERFGKRRIAHAPAKVEKVEPEPETHHPTGGEKDGPNLEALTEEEHRRLGKEIRQSAFVQVQPDVTGFEVPDKIEVIVKVELGEETRRLIERLLLRP